jgi:hypothetical protein
MNRVCGLYLLPGKYKIIVNLKTKAQQGSFYNYYSDQKIETDEFFLRKTMYLVKFYKKGKYFNETFDKEFISLHVIIQVI